MVLSGAGSTGAIVVEFNNARQFEQAEFSVVIRIRGVIERKRDDRAGRARGIGRESIFTRGVDFIATRTRRAVASVIEFDHTRQLEQADAEILVRIGTVCIGQSTGRSIQNH